MYQNLTNEMKDGFKPMMNMFEIQNRTAQKLMREQLDFMNECLEVGTHKSESLRDSDDKNRFFSVPVEASREIGEQFSGSMSRQWDILMEARDALTGEVQTVAKNARSTAERVTKEAQSTAENASEEAKDAVSKTAAKAESSASKSSGTSTRKS